MPSLQLSMLPTSPTERLLLNRRKVSLVGTLYPLLVSGAQVRCDASIHEENRTK